MLNSRRFVYGLALTGLTIAVSTLVAKNHFGNIYYLGQLLPLFLVAYLLLGWLLYLRRDQFLVLERRAGPGDAVLGHHEDELNCDLPEEKITGEELEETLVLDNGLVRRSPHDQQDSDLFWEDSMYAFVLSSCLLAVAAALAYSVFGIGASFFTP